MVESLFADHTKFQHRKTQLMLRDVSIRSERSKEMCVAAVRGNAHLYANVLVHNRGMEDQVLELGMYGNREKCRNV